MDPAGDDPATPACKASVLANYTKDPFFTAITVNNSVYSHFSILLEIFYCSSGNFAENVGFAPLHRIDSAACYYYTTPSVEEGRGPDPRAA